MSVCLHLHTGPYAQQTELRETCMIPVGMREVAAALTTLAALITEMS